MPGPQPGTLWIETWEGRALSVYIPYSSHRLFGPGAQQRNRRARAVRILRRHVQGDWSCVRCGDALDCDKRADARYCREGCRKAAARARRKERLADLGGAS